MFCLRKKENKNIYLDCLCMCKNVCTNTWKADKWLYLGPGRGWGMRMGWNRFNVQFSTLFWSLEHVDVLLNNFKTIKKNFRYK